MRRLARPKTTRYGLNVRQTEAAMHFTGPALVLAGPGTGKTTTLVGRYRFLLDQGVDPASILATTYTRAAAHQLKERISREAGVRASQQMIGTFHSLCLRLLRGELGEALGLDGKVEIISDADRFHLVRRVADKSLEAEDCIDAIDRWKDRLVGPAAARSESSARSASNGGDALRLADAYKAYQAELGRRGLYDFGDLLMLAVEALTTRDDLRRRYSSRYRFVMVDEFQDVNPAQHEVVRLLLHEHDNIWAVGDDDQAIYGWRGSDVRYFLDFSHRFPTAQIYRLSDNYRSQPVVVRGATHLVASNRSRHSKSLGAVADGSSQQAIRMCSALDGDREAEWIALSIQRLEHRGISLDDVAVLVRVRYLVPTLAAALAGLGIPHFIRGGLRIWSSTQAKALLGGFALSCGDNSNRWTVPNYLEREVSELVHGLQGAPFAVLIGELSDLIANRPPFQDKPERQIEWQGAVQRVAAESRLFEDPRDFLEFAAAAAAEESSPLNEKGVCVSTIHQAKGLEWRAVFLAGCETGIMPHSKADDLEEERRLAYVASTRAKEYLAITWAEARGDSSAGRSIYVAEFAGGLDDGEIVECAWPAAANGEKTEEVQTTPVDSMTAKPQLSRVAPMAAPERLTPRLQAAPRSRPPSTPRSKYRIGSEVHHAKYGLGTVVAAKGGRLDVKFEDGSRRMMDERFFAPVTVHLPR